MGAQLRGHEPAHGVRELEPRAGIGVVFVADAPGGRQGRETLAKALDAPALVIDRHDEPRSARGVDVRHQRVELGGIGVIACEEDHTSDQGMLEELPLLASHLRPLEIDHERAEGHVCDLHLRHA